jgi:hypothetical protein
VPSDRTGKERKVSSGDKKNELQKKKKKVKEKRNLDKKENRVIDDAVTSTREKNLFSSSLKRRKFFSLSKFLSRTHFFPFFHLHFLCPCSYHLSCSLCSSFTNFHCAFLGEHLSGMRFTSIPLLRSSMLLIPYTHTHTHTHTSLHLLNSRPRRLNPLQ